MSSTQDTVSWPPSLKEEVRSLIDLLFSLLDSKSEDVGPLLVDRIFTGDGRFFSSAGYFQAQDITKSRVGIWEKFEIRRHTLRKVYVNESDGMDLFIVGTVVIKQKGEEQTVLEFVARAVVRSTADGPRICYYQPVMPNPSDQPILADVDV